jgi:DNA-binding GntR family transcriptional regulator
VNEPEQIRRKGGSTDGLDEVDCLISKRIGRTFAVADRVNFHCNLSRVAGWPVHLDRHDQARLSGAFPVWKYIAFKLVCKLVFHSACKLARRFTGNRQAGLTRMAGTAGTNRSNEVYEWLRVAIVTGEMRPNEHLIEADLAERLAVSRTPIRECLQRLADGGLIVPRKRGWAVREYTPQEVIENSEVRAGLEGYATRLATTRATDEQLAAISAIHQQRLRIEVVDEKSRVATNRNFHDAIIAAAQNKRLTDAIYRSGQFYFNAPLARLTTAEEMKAGNADHQRIVDAMIGRDPAAAESAMRDHILRTFTIFQRFNR